MHTVMSFLKKIRKLPKKYLILGIIIILASLYFLLFRDKNTNSLQFTEVTFKNLKQEVSAPGTLSGKDNVNLRFKIGGKLSYIKVKVLDKVTKGQVIAGLDTQDLEIALRQAKNTLRDKRAIVDKIKDDLKDVTAESYTQRQTRTTAEVFQDNAYDSVLSAERAFQDTVIISPIDGVVAKADFLPGQIVSVTDTIAQVVDFSEIIFVAEVDEADVGKISLSEKAEISLNAYGDKVFKGKVKEILPEAKTTSNGATIVIVKIFLEDTLVKNILGLNGQVNIIISEKDNVLSIPLDALENNNSVFVKTPRGLSRQKVEVGFKTDTDVEIKKGLKEGDQVVTNIDAVKNLK